jgi:ABC-type Fe3+-hydroxamate transport system substrate-binding protein
VSGPSLVPRVISLVPSSTETLLALGADVVACTRFCEQPQLAHVGGPKNPDIAAIVALAPDLVVMDREENRRDDADRLRAAGLDLFVTDVRSVEEALAMVGDLAERLGLPPPPVASLPPRPADRTAFVPIWRRPWMTINGATYGASLLGRLGIELVSADEEPAYPTVELDEMAARDPDVVLVPSEPYEFEDRHMAELREAFGQNVPVVRVDGQDLFWWGARTGAAYGRLASQLSDT